MLANFRTLNLSLLSKVYIPLSQKDFLEKHLVRRRNQERDRLEYWSGTSKVSLELVWNLQGQGHWTSGISKVCTPGTSKLTGKLNLKNLNSIRKLVWNL